MWKKISVVAGGMVVAVALPFAALALTTDEFPDSILPADATRAAEATVESEVAGEVEPVEPTGPWVSPNAADPMTVAQAEGTMARQQLRVHAETGPPEGFEPLQQRLHADDPLGMGPGHDDAGQGQPMGNGQQNAPMPGAGDGECPNAGDGECPNDGVDCPDGHPMGGHGADKAGGQGRNG